MTQAKLATNPAEGHGLTSKLTDPTYSAMANGKPTESVVALVILKPVGLGQRETAKGRHQHVQFEATRLEPVLDVNQANELRYLIQKLYEGRTSTGQQTTIDVYGLGQNEERRHELIETIEDWSAREGMTGGALEARWRAEFGIGDGEEWSLGDQGVPGDYRKASVQFLLQFGLTVGAIDNGENVRDDDEDDIDEDDLDDEAESDG